MKMFAKLSFLLVMVMLVALGCSQKSGTEQLGEAPAQERLHPENEVSTGDMASQEQAAPADVAQPQAEAAPAESSEVQLSEIRGTVVKTDDGIVIFSDAGSFLVAGQDLSNMVGKNVKATGTVDEGGERPTITLSTVTLIE